MKQTLSIVGFGRFGITLLRLFGDDFEIALYDIRPEAFKHGSSTKARILKRVEDIYKSAIIVYAVPISKFEHVIREHRTYFKDHLLMDTLSVKIHPKDVIQKHIQGTSARALLTHPLFGPDSSQDGFAGLPLVLDGSLAPKADGTFWKKYFTRKGLRVLDMPARTHDELAASSQGVTHFTGRLLEEFGFDKTPIDTVGAAGLHKIKEQTCNDTWQLFYDLQNYNPFTKAMRLRLGRAHEKIYNRLLPKRVNPEAIVFGIQGGRGSFNEEALHDYVGRHHVKRFKITYLYVTEKVLYRLHRGDIDYGLFALHNSVGGVVDESLRAMARYIFHTVEEFAIPVRHFLMRRRDVEEKAITTIMAHSQVLKQCKDTLQKNYSHLIQKSGSGDLLDTAAAAHALAEGKIPPVTAVLGPRSLADLYDLDIIAENLQDEKDNRTSFLLVKR
jgi:prephenate dehydrogenase